MEAVFVVNTGSQISRSEILDRRTDQHFTDTVTRQGTKRL